LFLATKKRGVAVAVVMLLVFLIIAMTTASGILTSQNYTTGSFREKMMHADLAVKAGISTAMAKLTEDPLWAPSEASPYTEYLDPDQNTGFEIWLDINNEIGNTPVATSEGFDLQPGQVALRVRALINGEIVTGGFGGADQLIVLERPPVEFDHAIFRATEGELTIVADNGQILSYNSTAGVMPYQAFPAPPPAANEAASVRSLGDLQVTSTTIHGEAVLPTNRNVNTSLGGSVLSTTRLDEGHLPRIFESKHLLSGGMPSAGVIPPGDYDHATFAAGATVRLVRGGTYYVSDLMKFSDNVTLELDGPVTDGPVKVFCHWLVVGNNCRINLPAPGLPPIPEDLQFYGITQPGCARVVVEFGDDNEAAMVLASQMIDLGFGDRNVFYGAANINNFSSGRDLQYHYDEALRGQTFNTQTEWVLVSHGLR